MPGNKGMNVGQDPDSGAVKGWWALVRACSGTAQDRRNQYRFLGWLAAWALSYVGATWLLKMGAPLAGVTALGVAGVPNLFALLALLTYLRFLREADEMLRRIQLEGLALGFGAGAVFAFGYRLLEHAGAPALDLTAPIVVMMFGWAFGQLLGMRRYA